MSCRRLSTSRERKASHSTTASVQSLSCCPELFEAWKYLDSDRLKVRMPVVDGRQLAEKDGLKVIFRCKPLGKPVRCRFCHFCCSQQGGDSAVCAAGRQIPVCRHCYFEDSSPAARNWSDHVQVYMYASATEDCPTATACEAHERKTDLKGRW